MVKHLRERTFPLVIFGLILSLLVPILVMTLWGGAWRGRMMPGVMSPGMMSWRGFGYGWTQCLSWPALLIVFVGLVALGTYYVVSGCHASKTNRDRSLDILRERFAKGELTEEQFRRMKAEIGG